MGKVRAAVVGQAINCADTSSRDAALPDFDPPPRVLLTGATSQIGRALMPMLHAQGHRVVALSRAEQAPKDLSVEWHRVDLAEGWPDVTACEWLISFGPMQALANALSTLSAAPCQWLVATSSMSAESKRNSIVAEDRALSASLRQAESALITQCERLGIGWTVLRPTMIYGLGVDENLSLIARRALQTRLFPYPKGQGLRQPVHAEDVALAALHAMDNSSAQGKIIEIGGGERIRIDDMFRRLRDDMPVWTMPLPVPRWLMQLAGKSMPKLRGALSRVDDDLVANNHQLTMLLDVHPRGFSPDVTRWLEVKR